MRVLYLDHCARQSGGEIALARLLASLPDVEADVILGEEGPVIADLEKAGASVTVMPLSSSAREIKRSSIIPSRRLASAMVETARYTLRLARELRRRSPDLVVTNSLKSALYGGCAARLARLPVLWHLRDHVSRESLSAPVVALVRIAARVLPSGVVANSQSTMESLRIDDGRRSSPSFAVIGDPCEVPPSSVAPSGDRREIASGHGERQGGGDASLLVAMVGRICPWKGQHVFIDAFARAFPQGDERAVIVGGALFGEDDYEALLHDQVRRKGLSGRVTMVGHVDDTGPYYRAADVLVHASTETEPFGQVLVEAMGYSTPVIAARAGGPTEIVTHGVDGLLYTPGDVGELTRALQLLAGDRELREELARKARKGAARFSPKRIGPKTLSTYEQVARSAARVDKVGEASNEVSKVVSVPA